MIKNPLKTKKSTADNEICVEKQKGLLVGHCTDSGKEIFLPTDALPQHIAVCGATGSGTTILLDSLMKQQINNGGGLLYIDAHLGGKEFEEIYKKYVSSSDREIDLMIINPFEPENSNTYNPILFGDSQEISSRVMSFINAMTDDSSANYFRFSAQQAIETIIPAFKCLGKPYHLKDLASVFLHEQALMELKRLLIENHKEAEETNQLLALLSRYTTDKGFDMEKFKETLGGLAGRLHDVSTGTLGSVLNTYSPEVNLEECILKNKIVYVKLPMLSHPEQAVAIAKLIVADFRSAIGRCQRLPVEKLPNPPFMFNPNDCSSFIDTSWSRMFEQARTSRIFITTTFQSLQSLQPSGDEAISEIIMGNTQFKFFFKQLSLESATQAAEAVGKYIEFTVEDGVASEDGKEAYILEPLQFKSIPVGECYLLVGGKDLYKLRLPQPSPLDKANEFKGIVVNHFSKNEISGLNLSTTFMDK
jgi:hypothetical protein